MRDLKQLLDEIERDLQEIKSILGLKGTRSNSNDIVVRKRRKRKNPRWSEIETKQLIDLYKKYSNLTRKERTRIIAKILNMSNKRISNKVYILRKEGKI